MIPLGIILLLALAIRVWGIASDLPYIYNPDEPNYINIIQNIFKTGDLNPHFFNYPSLFFYINSLAYIPVYAIEKLTGLVQARSDLLPPISLAMGVTLSRMPATVILGRLVTIFFGVGTVGITYLTGSRLFGKTSIGLLAALMVALGPTNVQHSRYITPDTFVTFFALLAFLASILVYQKGRIRDYILAGLCVGLTASTKYNGSLVVLPLLLAHFLRHGKMGFKQPGLYLALLFCGVGFLVVTPYAILDLTRFMADLKFEFSHYSAGHPGMEGNALVWYLEYMWRTAGIIYLLAAVEIVRGIISRSKETILLACFPLVYLLFISGYAVRNERTLLPLTPFLFLLAASLMVYLLAKARMLSLRPWRIFALPAVVGLALVALIIPTSETLAYSIRLSGTDSREAARIWINCNVPAGAIIAIESYSPFVDPARFSVQGFFQMIDHPPEWYRQQGFDYLVFSQRMYGRYYEAPLKYALEVARYEALFNGFQLQKSFADGASEIRIYKVR